MTHIVDFLLARICEDERAAIVASELGGMTWTDVVSDNWQTVAGWAHPHVLRWNPARTLVECEAKRRIIDHITAGWEKGGEGWDTRRTLRDLAQPYAQHPDFEPRWSLDAPV